MPTPYMSLGLPTPGPNSAVPDWGNLLNTAFALIDSHDHTPGHGLPVPSAALNINADLPFNGFNLTQARTLRLQPQAAAPALATDAGCLYVTSAGDLWMNNGAGQHVQITNGAALSASSLGGISGLGGTAAGVAFSNSTKTFTFTQAANQGAILDAGPLVIHDTAASAFGITLQSPVGLAGAYGLTLPAALPASTKFLQVSSTGTIAASVDVANGITRANLAAVGQQVSASSGAFSTSSTSYVDVTNLSVTLTTTGRPVLILFQPDTAGSAQTGIAASGGTAFGKVLRDATVVGIVETNASTAAPASPGIYLDTPVAGTYTFKLQAKNSGVSSTSVTNTMMIVFEL